MWRCDSGGMMRRISVWLPTVRAMPNIWSRCSARVKPGEGVPSVLARPKVAASSPGVNAHSGALVR